MEKAWPSLIVCLAIAAQAACAWLLVDNFVQDLSSTYSYRAYPCRGCGDGVLTYQGNPQS